MTQPALPGLSADLLASRVEAAAARPDWAALAAGVTDCGGLALLLTARAAWHPNLAGTVAEAASRRWSALAARRADLRLALHEALANAVLHGSLGVDPALRDRADGLKAHARAVRAALEDPVLGARPVLATVLAEAETQACVMGVSDTGSGFVPPPAAAHAMPASRATRGRGLALIRTLCDQVRWRDGGRVIVMTVRPERERVA